MMNDKLKAMYAGGGLLKALLKDPKQREMAKGMLMKAEKGMAVKSYNNGGPVGLGVTEQDRKDREAREQRLVDKYFANRKTSVNNDGMGNNKYDEAVLREIQNFDKNELDYRTDRYYEEDGRGNKTPYIMSDNVTEIMGAPISYRKVPREAVEDYAKEKLMAERRRYMGIDDIPTYGMGGKPMKYRMGGNMPGEDEVVTEMDLDRIQDSPRGNFEYAGQDFLEQRAEDIEDAGKLLKFFAVTEAARMLDEDGISPRGMRPEKILSAARQKGLNPMTAAKDLFDREIDRRRM